MVMKFTKPLLALALGAVAIAAASPAAARDEWRGRRGGGDDAAIAIGAGIVGLAIGAAIASDDRPRYYDDRQAYYYSDYPAYPRGYYYNYPAYPVVRYRGYYESPRHEWREHRGWRGERRGWRRGGW